MTLMASSTVPIFRHRHPPSLHPRELITASLSLSNPTLPVHRIHSMPVAAVLSTATKLTAPMLTWLPRQTGVPTVMRRESGARLRSGTLALRQDSRSSTVPTIARTQEALVQAARRRICVHEITTVVVCVNPGKGDQ